MNGLSSSAKTDENGFCFEDLKKIATFLISQTCYRPKLGIICGTGFGGIADTVQDAHIFKYEDIPGFPVSTVVGHAGRLVFGNISGKECVCMQGRSHMYEGYPPWRIALPIRIMKLIGVELLIVTNACGGLNPEFKVGDIMVMKDHINIPGLAGKNPLIGKNESRFGPQFVAMSDAYDKELRILAKEVAKEENLDYFQEGVYVMQSGPCFETIAECKLLQILGADVAGMSTVPEVTVARHCGIKVLGMSLVTNQCIMDYDAEDLANHEEVLETGRMRTKDLQHFMQKLISKLPISQ